MCISASARTWTESLRVSSNTLAAAAIASWMSWDVGFATVATVEPS
jgi:hypothetical protein